jgi:hypothetical protein
VFSLGALAATVVTVLGSAGDLLCLRATAPTTARTSAATMMIFKDVFIIYFSLNGVPGLNTISGIRFSACRMH